MVLLLMLSACEGQVAKPPHIGLLPVTGADGAENSESCHLIFNLILTATCFA
jgi:hypothetical protein